MHDGIVNDSFAHLLQPDTLLPSQYFGIMKRKGAHEPERRLVVAVLEDAVECFQKHARARDPKARQLFLDAEEWICSEDRTWPFSFENVCDLLQINPEYLRHGLIAWKECHLKEQPWGNVVPLKLVDSDEEAEGSLQQVNAR
ncbi:MAG TPA: hypothetical protein VF515_05385 [Candidatus Binatia bacterium]|jgi:hypothetical protein